MAAAVARVPQTLQLYGGHVQTSQDALLDALLVSCEKPSTNPPLKSFGRDLKPYFPVAGATSLPPLINGSTSAKKITKGKVNSQPVAAAAAAAAASTKQPAAQNNKLGYAPKKTSHMKGRTATPKKEGMAAPIDLAHEGTPQPSVAVVHSEYFKVYLPWAGPGFYVSPSPDKLPSPTHLLLG